ncbi:MAG: glycosyltransferase family 1 protein [Prevotellaceae bacterium]|jgi:hypothetical protein|nr:glycosyltransferase family 1 protein [Prevotellaceae bacterium]
MNILLIGECSNLHANLAEGLRSLGHHVVVAASDNGWRRYRYDISLNRPTTGTMDGLRCLWRIVRNLHRFRGFDVVQISHPYFLRIRADRALPVYRYLRRHNKKVFLGAFGTDYYYARTCMEESYRYSDFKVGAKRINLEATQDELKECLYGGTARANQEIAADCNGIIACLWEYYVAYQPYFPGKTWFVPLPIDCRGLHPRVRSGGAPIRFFIGIQRDRSVLKGTDILLSALQRLQANYPEQCRLIQVENLPYEVYEQRLDEADVQLDQLYSYTPSMNSLLAMAKGIVVVGGGEAEGYALLGEHELHPIINVVPSEEDVYAKLEALVLHPEEIPLRSRQSIDYVARHHDHVEVARRYLSCWEQG